MKFGDIIEAAGFEPAKYPTLKDLPTKCFDDRIGRKIDKHDLFPFFKKNVASKKRFGDELDNCFQSYLNEPLENLPKKLIFEVRMSHKAIAIFIPSATSPAVFLF